ncbi:MAG TPA: twin-arginine translocation signal domain-containing protein, partial [Chitinophagaceae bacterium]|nr:twin-arginine translocation signal domain-containing protein [Chitinophagaceae bacterium]
MTDPLQRRDFIKTLSLAGASIAIASPVSVNEGSGGAVIKNEHFTVSFDRMKGTINIYRSNGVALLTGGIVCINSDSKHYVSFDNYKYTFDSKNVNDQHGPGKRLVILCKDKGKKMDAEIRLSLYDQLKAVTTEVICQNVSSRDLYINSIEPLRVLKSEGGKLNVPGVSKCITNGEMYYDTGAIHEFGTKDDAISSGNLKGVKLANGPLSSPNETVHSWWNAGLFNGYEKEGLVLGYLENDSCLGNLLITKTDDDEISFLVESVYAPQLLLKPGRTISSNRFIINMGADPYVALETYADAVGKANNARTRSIINGWCSWFYTLSRVSEAEVISNTEFAAKHLKQFGIEYIQVDEGYQRWHGDWEG